MALETVIACPICNGKKFDSFYKCIDYTKSKEEFSLVKCTECNFLITSPRPNSNSLSQYYESENYISHTNNSKNFIDYIYKRVRSITLKWKLNLIKRYKHNGNLLDYGCGTGEFLNVCQLANWQSNGIEPAQVARQKASNLTKLPIAESLNQLASEKFDVITLWHVLEHVEDLNEKISELKGCLAEGGIILIAVPNYESLDAKKYKSSWAGYDVPRHLWHFNQPTMRSLLIKHGLKLLNTTPMKQDSFYVSLLSEKYQHPNANLLTSMVKAFITGLQSNLEARKSQNYSSLVYIVTA